MKPSRLLTFAAVLGFAFPGAAQAQPGGGGRSQQLVQLVRTYADALHQNRQAAATLARDLMAACQQVLMLPDGPLDALELDLEAAVDAAKLAFEALPAAEQTEAKLSELIAAELALVFPTYTQDATQLASLEAAAQAFAAGVAPLELQLLQLRATFHQQMKALRP